MNFQKLMFPCLFLFVTGCWNELNSPLIKNQSGKEITVQLVFNDRKETFKVNNNDSLLLPNLTKDKTILSLKVISKNNDSVSLTKQEIIGFMEKKYKVFVVNEEFFIYPENKSSDNLEKI